MSAVPSEILNAVEAMLKPFGASVDDLADNGERKYMTPTQASRYCGLTAQTIRDKARAGIIKSVRLGKKSRKSRVLILRRSIDSWLESGENK